MTTPVILRIDLHPGGTVNVALATGMDRPGIAEMLRHVAQHFEPTDATHTLPPACSKQLITIIRMDAIEP